MQVRWLIMCHTWFGKVGHIKNALNDREAVLVGKDGREIDADAGFALIKFITEEADKLMEVRKQGAWYPTGGDDEEEYQPRI